MVVQWSRPSSDPVCGTVWYTITISSEGGVMIINTTMTSYDVTGLNNNTVYHVSVTANNNAGSSSSVTMMTMTNNIGKLYIFQLCVMYAFACMIIDKFFILHIYAYYMWYHC